MKRLCQHCIGAYRLSHRDEVELNKIGDLVGHDDAFLALDSLLNPHLRVSSESLLDRCSIPSEAALDLRDSCQGSPQPASHPPASLPTV